MPPLTTPIGIRGPGRQVRAGPTRVLARPWQGLGVWTPWDPMIGTPAFVRKTGSDSNGGTSSSDAWLTVGHALAAAAPGSTIYVGAGVYRETITVTITPTGSLPVAVVGDVDGSYTGDPGEVQVTNRSPDDTTGPTTAPLNLNGSAWLQFRNIFWVGGGAGAGVVNAQTAGSHHIAFINCAFLQAKNTTGGQSFIILTATTGPVFLDSCQAFGPTSGSFLQITAPLIVGGDYDAQVDVRNSVILVGNGVVVNFGSTGSGAGKPGGARIRNCFCWGQALATAGTSTGIPCSVSNSVIFAPGIAGISAGASGQIVEDYNLITAATPRTNVAIGAHSISNGSYATLFHFGQERIWGGTLRPFGEPTSTSPLTSFGNDGTQPQTDNRLGPRPLGAGLAAVGPFQRGNNLAEETSIVAQGLSVTGQGFADFDIAVDAGTISFSVYCQSDSSYSGQSPQLQILPNQEIGVGNVSTDSYQAGNGVREQLSATCAPTASGVVTVRLLAYDRSGSSKTVFDTFTAA